LARRRRRRSGAILRRRIFAGIHHRARQLVTWRKVVLCPPLVTRGAPDRMAFGSLCCVDPGRGLWRDETRERKRVGCGFERGRKFWPFVFFAGQLSFVSEVYHSQHSPFQHEHQQLLSSLIHSLSMFHNKRPYTLNIILY
jgi:hypothetical protein